MTVWTLASAGRTDDLFLGQSWESLQAAYGEPTDSATNNTGESSLYKYDEIELIFLEQRLWL